jgi:aryl-alcohol dehydrogenase-like predicted oxidoreductase
MTKIDGRTRELAAKQIDESLQRLQTDRIDLMQHHEIIRLEDPDRIFSEGGANEALVAAQKAGKIRFIGFTGHKDPIVHLRTLETAGQHGFRFDAVQMPLNVMDAHFRSFAKQVLPELVKENIGVLGMKPLASGAALKSGTVSAIECLQYALSLPASVVITGIDSMKYLDQAFEAVRTFKPFNEAQLNALLAKTREPAGTGKFERFKTAADFDATARNPAWIG